MLEIIKEPEQQSPDVERSLGWISLSNFNVEDWWITQDNMTVPKFGEEMLGSEF